MKPPSYEEEFEKAPDWICSLCGGDCVSKEKEPAFCPKCMVYSVKKRQV